jgi:uncharacterized protein YbgA (DUF1722 family)
MASKKLNKQSEISTETKKKELGLKNPAHLTRFTKKYFKQQYRELLSEKATKDKLKGRKNPASLIKKDSRQISVHITKLIVGYFNQTLTEEERETLDEWICTYDDNMRVFEEIVQLVQSRKELWVL